MAEAGSGAGKATNVSPANLSPGPYAQGSKALDSARMTGVHSMPSRSFGSNASEGSGARVSYGSVRYAAALEALKLHPPMNPPLEMTPKQWEDFIRHRLGISTYTMPSYDPDRMRHLEDLRANVWEKQQEYFKREQDYIEHPELPERQDL
jgi:hypothetical protein